MASQAQHLMLQGSEAFQAGQHDEALRLFDQALQADPGYADPFIGRASVFQAIGQADKMLEECERGIAIKPDYGPLYSTRAVAHGILGQNARSLQDFTRAIELDPKNTFYYINRAKTYIRIEVFEQAAEDFGRAAQVEIENALRSRRLPTEAVSYLRARAEMLRKAGKSSQAEQVEKEAADLEKRLASSAKGGCGKAAAVITLMPLWWLL
ncbi:hypothetical protein DYH09_09570 [bacterium CPR1]|nr:hypothetical protein [bacterium CPR1]